ncbi:MAG: ABC transporter ATP-binding protein [Actinomycetota bacterium]|jgi:ABC-2 type transport system ATP-binding protein|nr:ABC transporter ATP-binding protein [Actinomycetota bacterium]
MDGNESGAAISLRAVSRWFGDVVAVNDVTYDFRPGVTGLLGPNGAGKSTLLHMMAGMLQVSAGEVMVRGESTWRNIGMFDDIGLVPEREAVYPFLTAREYVTTSAKLHRMPDPEQAARAAIEMVELTDAQDRKMGGYSKGMKQRAKIAAALVHDPQILILDEPFNGTDPRQRLQMTEMLQALGDEGRTIVFSSHILEDVEHLATEVMVIVGGRLAASGDFRRIRRMMTDRPHSFTITTSDNRAVAGLLVHRPDIAVLSFTGDQLQVQTTDFGAFTEMIAGVLVDSEVELYGLEPADDSLENVFTYLVDQ